jgi:GT2 family glycosyltransferase
MFAALEASRGALRLQVIVIDNASSDRSVEILRTRYPSVELIENPINVGFGRANNQALPRLCGRYILLLNTDAFVSPDTLEKTVSFMDLHPHCGVLGVKLVREDGTLQPSFRDFPKLSNVFWVLNSLRFQWRWPFLGKHPVDTTWNWDCASERECDWVPGCYYLTRREVIERVGLFDPRYFLYSEETDHCHAVRQAGWTVICYPFTQVVHLGGESARSVASLDANRNIPLRLMESELLYFRKHYGVFGILVVAFLTVANDFITGGWGLMRHWDLARPVAAARHTWKMIRLLVATGLASRSTR